MGKWLGETVVVVGIRMRCAALQFTMLSPPLAALQIVSLHPQRMKAFALAVVPEAGILIESRLRHAPKQRLPMLVTKLGIVIERREMAPLKALAPMLVTELGIVIAASLLHS